MENTNQHGWEECKRNVPNHLPVNKNIFFHFNSPSHSQHLPNHQITVNGVFLTRRYNWNQFMPLTGYLYPIHHELKKKYHDMDEENFLPVSQDTGIPSKLFLYLPFFQWKPHPYPLPYQIHKKNRQTSNNPVYLPLLLTTYYNNQDRKTGCYKNEGSIEPQLVSSQSSLFYYAFLASFNQHTDNKIYEKKNKKHPSYGG